MIAWEAIQRGQNQIWHPCVLVPRDARADDHPEIGQRRDQDPLAEKLLDVLLKQPEPVSLALLLPRRQVCRLLQPSLAALARLVARLPPQPDVGAIRQRLPAEVALLARREPESTSYVQCGE